MAIGKIYNLGSYQAVRFPKDFPVELGEYEIHKEGNDLILRKVKAPDPAGMRRQDHECKEED